MTAPRSCLPERMANADAHTHSWQCAQVDYHSATLCEAGDPALTLGLMASRPRLLSRLSRQASWMYSLVILQAVQAMCDHAAQRNDRHEVLHRACLKVQDTKGSPSLQQSCKDPAEPWPRPSCAAPCGAPDARACIGPAQRH